MALKDGATVELPLAKAGENTFKMFVFDAAGGPVALPNNRIVIARTAATIDAIPASSSIGIEVLRQGRRTSGPDYLVKEGDPLPKKGKKVFKAGESLRAGAAHSLQSQDLGGRNRGPGDRQPLCRRLCRFVGADFETGAIAAGADLICDYEVLDSGQHRARGLGAADRRHRSTAAATSIRVRPAESTIPDASSRWPKRRNGSASDWTNFRQRSTTRTPREGRSSTSTRPQTVEHDAGDPETTKQAMDRVLEAKKLLAQVRKEQRRGHSADGPRQLRQVLQRARAPVSRDLRRRQRSTTWCGRRSGRSTTKTTDFESSARRAAREELRDPLATGLVRGRSIQVDGRRAVDFADRQEHGKLVEAGKAALQADDFAKLRQSWHAVLGFAQVPLGRRR